MAKKSNAQLIARLREVAGLETFSPGFYEKDKAFTAENIRASSRLYRETWVYPVIDEIERRLIRKPKARA